MSESDKIKTILSVYIGRFVNIRYKDEEMFRTVKVLSVFDDRIRALENGIDKTFLFNRIKTIVDPEFDTPFENTGYVSEMNVPRNQVKSREVVVPRVIQSKIGNILSNFTGKVVQIKYKDEDMYRIVNIIRVLNDRVIAVENDIEKAFLLNRIRKVYDPETTAEYDNEGFTLDAVIRSRPKESKRYLTKSREQKKPKGISATKSKGKPRRTLLSREQPQIREVKMSSRRFVEEQPISLEEFERERRLQQRLASSRYREEMEDVLGSFGNIGIQEDDEDELAGLMGRSLFVNKTQRNPFEMRIKRKSTIPRHDLGATKSRLGSKKKFSNRKRSKRRSYRRK